MSLVPPPSAMSPESLNARRRGLAIHAIRTGMTFRHAIAWSSERRQLVGIIRTSIATLRELGPGPVAIPDPIQQSPRSPRITWWGKK